MGKYIKYYDTHLEYGEEKDLLDLPNVSWCEQEEDVHYIPEDYYYNQYLTFDIINSGTITFEIYGSGDSMSQRTIYYSNDDGITWITFSNTLNVTSGQKILFKGNNDTYSIQKDSTHTTRYYSFGGTATFNASGNIMSMIGGNNFINITTFGTFAFRSFFRNSNIINAKNLILPVTSLTESCYNAMFYSCTNLIAAPTLPATTLVSNCYASMFDGCSNLNYIKAMFTTGPDNMYTYRWVSGVSSTGTFVKNSAATWTTTGDTGVPTGWTVIIADS